ncbi:hypothetical protein OROGR_006806 [Orobanche gracilis]
MKSTYKFLVYVTYLFFISTGFLIVHINAKKISNRKLQSAGASLSGLDSSSNSNTFDVMNYGAIGDGKSDDTDAFASAWAAACKEEGSTVLVPSGSTFLVNPIPFSCQSKIIFQLEGTIIAPQSPGAWSSKPLQWLDFTSVDGLIIQGKGVIDGQGSVWWNGGTMPSTKPTALRVANSKTVTVTGITIQNSQQAHLKFDNCDGVQKFLKLQFHPPEIVPTQMGSIYRTPKMWLFSTHRLDVGDDCISIQTGCSGINIHDVKCGPSHGISIGGLGKGGTEASVSDVTVRDSSVTDSLCGVRIKTWQGGSGSVQETTFSNIQVSGVQIPIVIDQYYSDGGSSTNKLSAVAISGISYASVTGTYTKLPMSIACSDSTPCTHITLSDIELTSSFGNSADPFCWKVDGEVTKPTAATTNCLQT